LRTDRMQAVRLTRLSTARHVDLEQVFKRHGGSDAVRVLLARCEILVVVV
jgi:hypothetical protein